MAAITAFLVNDPELTVIGDGGALGGPGGQNVGTFAGKRRKPRLVAGLPQRYGRFLLTLRIRLLESVEIESANAPNRRRATA